jgi:hypothetical protein
MRALRLAVGLGLAAGLGAATPAFASPQAVDRPVVVELFTSQGCSSCPPADALVATLARTRPDVLALTFHVTYWNNLGWHDPFSFAGATDRQRHYVALAVSPQIYTPAMVVDGRWDVIGSDGPAVAAALAQAAATARNAAPVAVTRAGNTLTISIGPGTGRGAVVLIGYDRQHQTQIARGENGGRTLTEANIVRSMRVAGSWTGGAVQFTAAMPDGETAAVIVQAEDGSVLGAGRLAGASQEAAGS